MNGSFVDEDKLARDAIRRLRKRKHRRWPLVVLATPIAIAVALTLIWPVSKPHFVSVSIPVQPEVSALPTEVSALPTIPHDDTLPSIGTPVAPQIIELPAEPPAEPAILEKLIPMPIQKPAPPVVVETKPVEPAMEKPVIVETKPVDIPVKQKPKVKTARPVAPNQYTSATNEVPKINPPIDVKTEPKINPPIDANELPPLVKPPKPSNPVATRAPTSLMPTADASMAHTPTPPASEQNANSGPCRIYSSEKTVLGQPREVNGLACRSNVGVWEIITENPAN